VFAILAGELTESGAAEKEKLSGISKEDYPGLYLDAKDVEGWKLGQDTRNKGPDRSDKTFGKLGGVSSGFMVWRRRTKGHLERIVDIRWVFPSSAAARAYVKDQLGGMAETMKPVKDAPKFGDESYVFGGLQEQIFDAKLKFRSYIIVFRQNNVVVKFYQYDDGATSPLRPLTMSPTCLKIIKRIKASAR
jgi:hypothetical protein